MKGKILIAALGLMVTTGCYYDNEAELYGMNCDTVNVTYSSTIKGIINGYNCLSCHSGASPSGNINLETHTNVKIVADNGKLLGAITHSPGFTPMPQGGSKMSPCDINKVKAWIDKGEPND